MDQKSSGRSLAPSRIFQTQTVFDLSGNVLSSGPLASTTGKMIDPGDQADLHRRDPGRLCDAAGRRATASTCSSCRATMHNFIEDVPSRLNGTAPDSGPFVAANLPCVAFAACQIGRRQAHLPRRHRRRAAPAGRRLDERHQLHVEPVRGQLRSRLLARSRCSTPRRSSRTAPAPTSRIRTASVRCSRIGRTCSRCSRRTRPTRRLTAVGLPARAERHAVGGARPRLGGRGAELPRAGRQPSQPDVGEPRSDGDLPPAAAAAAPASRSKRG